MAALVLQLATAGLAAVRAPAGTEQTVIAELGLTAHPFLAAPTLTALPGEFKRLDILSGVAASPTVAHITAYDTSADVWSATGFGLFLEDGTLFASFSADEPVLSKAGLAFALMAFDIAFNADVLAEITFGDATFVWPPATETTRGIARLSTQARVDAAADGEDDAQTIVTPKTLRARLTTLWTAVTAAIGVEAQARGSADSALGTRIDAEITARTNADAALNTDIQQRLLSASYTAADVLAKVKSVDGATSGLDADLLDGFEGSTYSRIVQSQLVENGGYEVFASGKKVTWGKIDVPENQYVVFPLPVAHTSWVNPVLGIGTAGGISDVQDNTGITAIVTDANGAPTGVRIWNADNRTISVWVRTIGV